MTKYFKFEKDVLLKIIFEMLSALDVLVMKYSWIVNSKILLSKMKCVQLHGVCISS